MPWRDALRGISTPAASSTTLTTQTSAHVGHSTCLPVTLLASAADCRVSLPNVPSLSWCRNLAGAALRHLAALLAGVLSPCKTSLALLMVQVYGLYHPFAAAEALRYCCSGELPAFILLLHF